ncbi:50S ribosomal protein L11 methyltransferase [Streptomyces sp. H27-D2]|uniref:50S ribosomal protein L11 methyltransferase n=1 Tax=Streptomyces sp. H27-D2 TaxID=3046304 RepID=UPI003FA7C1B3
MNTQVVRWTEAGEDRSARWRSESGAPAPKRVVIADDETTADAAYRMACEGTAMLWRGDFHNARQLLQAMARRIDRKPRRSNPKPGPAAATDAPATEPTPSAVAFHRHRQAQNLRARTLGMLLVPLGPDHAVELRRAPDVRLACAEAYGPADEPSIASLRELLGLIGAHEWRRKGVEIASLGDRIHPHYGVFSPVRSEYVDLVAEAALPSLVSAFDIGTGTGILAAVLAGRGVKHVVATDLDQRAVDCAGENLARLGLTDRVSVLRTDLFPLGRAPLVVCNPPWVPARPATPVDHAVYDPGSRMLLGFLDGLAEHLEPGGEGWLLLSDLAEHLGLRTREELLAAIDAAGLTVLGRADIQPTHRRVFDESDPLHVARAAEVTSLWRLGVR